MRNAARSLGKAVCYALVYSVIESCRMAGIQVDRYLHLLLQGLKKALKIKGYALARKIVGAYI